MSKTVVAIERVEGGKAPKDFEPARTGQGRASEWQVVDDASANGGRAIEQSSNDTTDYRFPLAIYRTISAKDVEVALRFKPVGGKIDRAGGIALRLIDADNYYVLRANALEDNVRLYRVIKGRREQIAGANLKVTSDQWHRLGLKAQGDAFTVTYDSQELYRATDKTLTAPGRVALWTKADSITRFDSVEITVLAP